MLQGNHVAASFPQEWYRFDEGAPWKGPGGRPGPSPFKPEGNVFASVPGCTAVRIKPDLVHTFHIGFGTDFAASCIVWLAKLNKFGRLAFDEKLRTAYGMFQEFCHLEKRYTSCDEWRVKKFGMASTLAIVYVRLLLTIVVIKVFFALWVFTVLLSQLRANDFPTSLAGKGHDTAVVCRWLQQLLVGLETLSLIWLGFCFLWGEVHRATSVAIHCRQFIFVVGEHFPISYTT